MTAFPVRQAGAASGSTLAIGTCAPPFPASGDFKGVVYYDPGTTGRAYASIEHSGTTYAVVLSPAHLARLKEWGAADITLRGELVVGGRIDGNPVVLPSTLKQFEASSGYGPNNPCVLLPGAPGAGSASGAGGALAAPAASEGTAARGWGVPALTAEVEQAAQVATCPGVVGAGEDVILANLTTEPTVRMHVDPARPDRVQIELNSGVGFTARGGRVGLAVNGQAFVIPTPRGYDAGEGVQMLRSILQAAGLRVREEAEVTVESYKLVWEVAVADPEDVTDGPIPAGTRVELTGVVLGAFGRGGEVPRGRLIKLAEPITVAPKGRGMPLESDRVYLEETIVADHESETVHTLEGTVSVQLYDGPTTGLSRYLLLTDR